MVIMMGVAKKKPDNKVKKPELMEQNQDALEYSSEGETENLDDAMGKLKEKGKKDLVKIDHAGIEYKPFRKNFYFEVPELAKMTDLEVEDYRTEMEGIKTKGKNCPRPIKNWPQCGVSSKILNILKKNGYEKPTPIQAEAIPVVMSGRDIIGIAKTGSGKTMAFLLPLFRHIADQDPLEEGDGPIAILMTPTRELCMQIGRECKKFSKGTSVRTVCVYGGTGISEQIAELKRGAEIIVCTPGRMIDMLAEMFDGDELQATGLSAFLKDLIFQQGIQQPILPRIPDLSDPSKFGLTNTSHFFISSPALGTCFPRNPASYGDSSPVTLSEKTVVEDARAALTWIHENIGFKAEVFVFGHSLVRR